MTRADNIDGRGNSAGNAQAGSSATEEYFKERLMQDAGRVEQKDIDELETSVPKKLAKFDLEGLGDGAKWINTMLDRVATLFAMIRDKEYTIPRKKLMLIGAGLLYFVLPTDLTPDFIPGIGFIDDAVVLGMLWKMVSEEVETYLSSHRRIFPE